jgi:hypothetical protein
MSSSTAAATPVENEWIRLERTIDHVGKLRKDSKRRIEWQLEQRPNPNDLPSSLQRMRVVLTWSVRSGKYSIHVNEREEAFDRRRGASLLDHTLEVPLLRLDSRADSNHPTTIQFRVVAARVIPRQTPFCQYELLLNGVRFHRLSGPAVLEDEGLPSLLDILIQSK